MLLLEYYHDIIYEVSYILISLSLPAFSRVRVIFSLRHKSFFFLLLLLAAIVITFTFTRYRYFRYACHGVFQDIFELDIDFYAFRRMQYMGSLHHPGRHICFIRA